MKNGKKTMFIENFHKLSLKRKIELLRQFAQLSAKDLSLLKQYQKLPDFIDFENNIGPFKIAPYFLINKKEYFVPMETEEPSVVAAASWGAKFFLKTGGFEAKSLNHEMIGQIVFKNHKNSKELENFLNKKREEILKIANDTNPLLLKLQGGAKDFFIKKIKQFTVFYLIVDPKDAQGANIVNTMLETIALSLPYQFKKMLRGCIISNFSPQRLTEVKGRIEITHLKEKFPQFSEKEIGERFLDFYQLAKEDIFRAVTHNKGIMNGIDAVLLATGNDFRAVEAACHSFAQRTGKYQPLTEWKMENNTLLGKIVVPLPLGTVGGATETKKAKLAKKILKVESSKELAFVCASVGLANNFSAVLHITTEGIQKGHMKLHKQFLKKIN